MITETDMKRIQVKVDLIRDVSNKTGKVFNSILTFIFKNLWIVALLVFFGIIFSIEGFITGMFKRENK